MAEANTSGGAADSAVNPSLVQGQTTSVAEGAQAVQEQPGQEAAQEQLPAPSLWDNWLLYAVIGLWVWWLFGNKKRKAQKAEEKKERARRDTLQKGDQIVTIGRLHGTVVAFTDTTVTLKPDGKADYSMTFDRVAIQRVLPRPGEEDEAEEVKQ